MSPIRSSLLLGAGAAASSYQIQRSLRCNSSDSASLSRASYAGSGTFSCWVKRCKLGTAQTIISGVAFNASDQLNSSTAVFRDPSAWMHVLVSTSGTYVNGTSVASGSAITPGIIGSGCDLYLADIHFIDGQALTPSSFTEVSDTTGQLIPKAYTGSYGTNGFQLKFADNSSNTATTLGKDTSGNGNNWTTNNFAVTPVNSYQITGYDITNGGGAFANATLPASGNGTNAYHFPRANATYTLGKTLTATTKIEAYCYIDGTVTGTITANGGTAKTVPIGSTYAWQKVNLGVTSLSSISLAHSNWTSPGQDFWLSCFIVDDVVVYGTPALAAGNDSLVDTPVSSGTDTGAGGQVTGNYCTWNPLANSAAQLTYSNGNLDIAQSNAASYALPIGTIRVSSGKWYWETTITSGGSCRTGVLKDESSLSTYLGSASTAYAYASGGYKANNNSNTTSGYSTYTNGDVIGIALDLDNGKVYFSKNGTWQESGNPATQTNPAYTGLLGTYFASWGKDDYVTTSCSINFGQRPFAYTAPSGFKALCDTNLPSTTITTSGSYTGNGVADGPFVYLNGVPTAMTIGGNAVTFGTHADKLANGFKIRTSSTTYNQNASSYNYSITSTGAAFKNARAQPNP